MERRKRREGRHGKNMRDVERWKDCDGDRKGLVLGRERRGRKRRKGNG